MQYVAQEEDITITHEVLNDRKSSKSSKELKQKNSKKRQPNVQQNFDR
jgi:hypothetical protein